MALYLPTVCSLQQEICHHWSVDHNLHSPRQKKGYNLAQIHTPAATTPPIDTDLSGASCRWAATAVRYFCRRIQVIEMGREYLFDFYWKWWSMRWEPRTAALLFKSTTVSQILLSFFEGELFPSDAELIISARLIDAGVTPLGELWVQWSAWSIFRIIWSFCKLCCSLNFFWCQGVLPEGSWCWARLMHRIFFKASNAQFTPTSRESFVNVQQLSDVTNPDFPSSWILTRTPTCTIASYFYVCVYRFHHVICSFPLKSMK